MVAANQPSLADFGANVGPDYNKGPQLLKIIWSLLGISMLFITVRIYVKLKTTSRLWWDDLLLVLAEIFGLLHASFITSAVSTGLGRHMKYLTAQELSHTLRIGLWSFAWAFMSPMTGRLSFCVFLLWVVWTNPKIPRWPLYFAMVTQVVINIATVVVMYSQCGTHLSVLWTVGKMHEIPERCWNFEIQAYWGYASGSVNSLTDLFLTIFPAVVVSFSSLTWKSRIGLCSVLCLSCVALVASIKRTIEARQLSQFLDFTYDLVEYVIWISAELNVVIIASTIPLLRPLFKRGGLSRIVSPKTDPDALTEVDSISMHETKPPRVRSGSVSSQEKILSRPSVVSFSQPETFIITKTIEVSVASRPVGRERGLVHAALIGLPTD